MKTKEELEAVLKMVDETNRSSTTINDYHKMRRREGVLEVHEMLQRPKSWEDIKNMLRNISKTNNELNQIDYE